jgi:large subunit ribosomal protein L21
VRPDQTLQVDRLAAEAGSTVEFREVLLIGDNGGTQIGNPFVEGARVIAEVLEQGRDRKVMVFKYKNKTRYRRRHGHRQQFTSLTIREILTAGGKPATEPEGEKKPARKASKRSASGPEPGEIAEVEAAAVESEAHAKPKRTSRPRKPAAKPEGSEDAPKPARRARTKKSDSGE